MGVTTSLMVGSALVGGGMGLYGAYLSSEAQKDALEAQQEALRRKREADRAASKVRFEAEKENAHQYAETLTGQAGETQKEADASKQIQSAQLASGLDSSARQSRVANRNAASIQGQGIQAVSGITAHAAGAGLKMSGSMAKASVITQNEAATQLASAKDEINSALRQADSGATSTMQGINEQYDTAMFNKNALLTKASQTTSAYEEGGTAYKVYQANDVYDEQLTSIQSDLYQQQIDATNASEGFSMLSGAFNGLSSGLSFGLSMYSLSGMFGGGTGKGFNNASSLLTGNNSMENPVGATGTVNQLNGVNNWNFSLGGTSYAY